MDENQILEQLNNADKRDINYFEILGTDRENDSQKSFPPEYFAYREEWNSRRFKATPFHKNVQREGIVL